MNDVILKKDIPNEDMSIIKRFCESAEELEIRFRGDSIEIIQLRLTADVVYNLCYVSSDTEIPIKQYKSVINSIKFFTKEA